ncbi:MAG: hypothetical protein KIT62_07525 [Cyclobacteriaceae bacterium]|nr:hypothetical protein [Cyclobacteriaceae bacterium]
MNSSEIRDRLIDQILSINDTDYLLALSKLIEAAKVELPVISLTEDQKMMIEMSEVDIVTGRVIEQSKLTAREMKWLSEK